jgi:hypothetical protein
LQFARREKINLKKRKQETNQISSYTTKLVEKGREAGQRIELTTEGLPGGGVLRRGAAERQEQQEQGRAEKGAGAAVPPHCRPAPAAADYSSTNTGTEDRQGTGKQRREKRKAKQCASGGRAGF